jgi:collagen type III alpha
MSAPFPGIGAGPPLFGCGPGAGAKPYVPGGSPGTAAAGGAGGTAAAAACWPLTRAASNCCRPAVVWVRTAANWRNSAALSAGAAGGGGGVGGSGRGLLSAPRLGTGSSGTGSGGSSGSRDRFSRELPGVEGVSNPPSAPRRGAGVGGSSWRPSTGISMGCRGSFGMVSSPAEGSYYIRRRAGLTSWRKTW